MKNFKLTSMIEQQDVYGPPVEDVYSSKKNRRTETAPQQVLYGPPEDTTRASGLNTEIQQQAIYGPPPNNYKANKIIKGTNIAISIVLFVLGVIALINKSLSKKAKAIIIGSLVLAWIIITLTLTIFANMSK